MNILIIPSWYQTKVNPTLGSFFREQAIALSKEGHKVSIAYTDIYSSFKDGYKGIKYLRDSGVNIYRISKYKIPRTGFQVYNLVFYSGVDRIYRKIVEEQGKPDIIHVHSSILAGYSGMRLSKKYNIPYVITEHYTGFARGLIKGRQNKLIGKVFLNSSKVIAVSNALKNDIKHYCGENQICVIPNMTNVNTFQIPHSKKLSKFVFLTVCYLTHKKGIDLLLRAFAVAFNNNENVKLIVSGDGEERAALVNLTTNLQINNKVTFTGELSRENVVKSMQSCDAFVLPSRFETFGVVFIEALACGKPIIASQGDGPDDIVNCNNGLLVEKENVQELSEAMKYIYNNKDKYIGEFIRQECIDKYSEKAVASQIINIYRLLIKKTC